MRPEGERYSKIMRVVRLVKCRSGLAEFKPNGLLHSVAIVKFLDHIQLFWDPPQTIARQALLSMGLPRLEYLSRFPFPFPGDLPNPGIRPHLLHQ